MINVCSVINIISIDCLCSFLSSIISFINSIMIGKVEIYMVWVGSFKVIVNYCYCFILINLLKFFVIFIAVYGVR